MAGFDTAQVIVLLLGTVFPLIVGFVTRASWSGFHKGLILAAMSAASAFLSEAYDAVVAGVHFHWQVAVVTAIGVFLTAVGTHFGLWKQHDQLQDSLAASGVKDARHP